MDSSGLTDRAAELSASARALADQIDSFSRQALAQAQTSSSHGNDFVFYLTIFALACFVGYYVVWRVTPALHSPLMSVTNAVSSVIVVGALIAAGPAALGFSKIMGFVAVILASVNIFGGFIVTQRMLSMFRKKS